MTCPEFHKQNSSTNLNTYNKENFLSQRDNTIISSYDSSNKNNEDILQYSRTTEDTINDKRKDENCNSLSINIKQFKRKNFIPKSILINKIDSQSFNQCITNNNMQYSHKEKPNAENLIFQ
jgi:late competence protein required for DNA uptake (superfamily II DNA/RNA helicase)